MYVIAIMAILGCSNLRKLIEILSKIKKKTNTAFPSTQVKQNFNDSETFSNS